MYYLNKIVGVMANPTVVCLILLAASGWLLGGKKRLAVSCWRLAFAVFFVGFLIWGTALPARILGLSLEREWLVDGKPPRAESFPTADAIVCLGGGMGAATNGFFAADMATGADRVWMAARLYKAGKAPKVFCTGPCCETSTKELLVDLGVPTNALVFLEEPRNTEEESREIARQVEVKGGGGERKVKALLVTSAWHMRRAKYMFEKYAPELEIVPAATDFESVISFSDGFKLKELIPSAGAMQWNEIFFREWLGFVGYRYFR